MRGAPQPQVLCGSLPLPAQWTQHATPTGPEEPLTDLPSTSELISPTSNEAERFLQAVGSAAHWLYTRTHTHTHHELFSPFLGASLLISLLGALET